VALLALFLAAGGGNAFAAAASFLLNTTNTSSAPTTLNGSAVAGKALQITNTSTASGASALGLTVASGHAPFTVSSGAAKVANLNADKLDGLDSTQLRLHCPAGLQLAGDVCFEPTLRPVANYVTALATCASAQRRLPTDGELALVFDHVGAPQQIEWTSSHFFDGNNFAAATLFDDQSRVIHLVTTSPADGNPSDPYRCVTSPTN
jgi:hypothetical protein